MRHRPRSVGPQGGRARIAHDSRRADARLDVPSALEQARARSRNYEGYGGAPRPVAVPAGKGRLIHRYNPTHTWPGSRWRSGPRSLGEGDPVAAYLTGAVIPQD